MIRNIPDSILDNYRGLPIQVGSNDPGLTGSPPKSEIHLKDYYSSHLQEQNAAALNEKKRQGSISSIPSKSPKTANRSRDALNSGSSDGEDDATSGLDIQVQPESSDLTNLNVVEELPVFVHILSSRGLILFTSAHYTRRHLEYQPEDLVNQPVQDFVHPADSAALLRELKIASAGSPISIYYRLRKKSGEYVGIEASGHKFEMENKKKTKCVILCGRSRKSGQDVQRSLMQSVLATPAIPNIRAKLSPEGLILYVSPSSALLLDQDNESLYGCSIVECFQGASSVRVKQALERLPGGSEPILGLELVKQDGSPLWMDLFWDPSPDAPVVYVKITGVKPALSNHPLTASNSQFEAMWPLDSEEGLGIHYETNRLKAENQRLKEQLGNMGIQL